MMLEPTMHVAGLSCRVVVGQIFSGPEHVRAEDRGPAEAAWGSFMDP